VSREGDIISMQDSSNEKLTLTVPEVAKLLGLSRNAIYEAVKRGRLRSVRLGRRILIPRQSFLDFLTPEGERYVLDATEALSKKSRTINHIHGSNIPVWKEWIPEDMTPTNSVLPTDKSLIQRFIMLLRDKFVPTQA
jgi:excisionase family DNA binding protein